MSLCFKSLSGDMLQTESADGEASLEGILAGLKADGYAEVFALTDENDASARLLSAAGAVLEWEKEGSRCFRIKTDRAERITDADVLSILECWPISHGLPERAGANSWRAGDGMLKAFRDAETPQRTLELCAYLSARNVPVPEVIPARDGRLILPRQGRFFMLTRRIKGVHPDALADGVAEQTGMSLARLHKALEPLEGKGQTLLDELNGWVSRTLEPLDTPLAAVCGELTALWPDLPCQLIHRDPHPGNLLFDGGRFAGFIDFDLARYNLRIFDPCYFAAGVLANEGGSGKWFLMLRALFGGYESCLSLSRAERKSAAPVMAGIELLFAAWFMRDGYDGPAQSALEWARWIMRRRADIEVCV